MAVSSASASQTHVVAPGETLSHIATSYGVTVAEIAAINGIADPNFITAGQSLTIRSAENPAPAPTTTSYVVQPGDTLSGIAAAHGLSLAELIEANGIVDPNFIVVGQTLTIGGTGQPGAGVPAPPEPRGTHTVQPGETLELIAREYGVLVRAIVELNDLRDANVIFAGQVLDIPAKAAATTGHRVSYETAEAALRNAEIAYALPPGLLRALSWQESGFQQHVVSEAGAVGLTQIMPATAEWALEWLAPDMVNWYSDPVHNAYMGAAILRHWLNLADWDVEYALGAYYQGWHAMETEGPYLETERYVANVLALIPRFAT